MMVIYFLFDIESTNLKMFVFSHINNSYRRICSDSEKDFCEFVEINCRQLLYHKKTMWLRLFPALEILNIFERIISFPTEEICSYYNKVYFENELSELYLCTF